jgi:hypothetical protein
MKSGLKHVIPCRCILTQFKRLKNPPFHKFVVFSVLDDDQMVHRFVQCNNCGVIHKVTDVGRSEILQTREHMASIVTLDEVKTSVPEKLGAILEANQCDLATWESVAFIVENQKWGDFVVLNSDEEGGTRQGKFVRILSESLFKVESFTREEVV